MRQAAASKRTFAVGFESEKPPSVESKLHWSQSGEKIGRLRFNDRFRENTANEPENWMSGGYACLRPDAASSHPCYSPYVAKNSNHGVIDLQRSRPYSAQPFFRLRKLPIRAATSGLVCVSAAVRDST